MKRLFLEIRTNRLRKLLLKSNREPDKGLKVIFQNSNDYGWIDMLILSNNNSIKIDISDTFPPFKSFVYFLYGIYKDRLPNYWLIDEEGICKQLFVYAVDNKNLRLVIVNDCFIHENYNLKDLDKIVLDTIVTKKEFLREFYFAFSKFVKKDFRKEDCEYEDLFLILKFLEYIFNEGRILNHRYVEIHPWS